MKRTVLMIAFMALALLTACEKHENLPTAFDYDPPPTPTDFQIEAGEKEATLTWNYPEEAKGSLREYRVYYYYNMPYEMLEFIDTTSVTLFVDSLLISNLPYCYKVSAVDKTGLEGWRTPAECVLVR